MLLAIHAAQVRPLFDACFHIRNSVCQLDSHRVRATANLHVREMMPFLAVLAWFIREPPDQIGNIIAEFASNIVDSRTRIFYCIVQPRGRQKNRVLHPELAQIGDHPGQVIGVEVTTTINLARVCAAGKIGCTLLDVVHTH